MAMRSSHTLKQALQSAVSAGLEALYELSLSPDQITVQVTSRDHDGDFTVMIFPLLRYKIGKPDAVGQQLGTYLRSHCELVRDYTLVKGFLNLHLESDYWQDFLQERLEDTRGMFFRQDEGGGQTVMIEFLSPNTNKPLHLGHLRNGFLGQSVSNILEAVGYKVVNACLYNDKGIHICKSMRGYQLFGEGEDPDSAGIKGDFLVGKYYVAFEQQYREQVEALKAEGMEEDQARKEAPLFREAQEMYRRWETGDPDVWALWKKMNAWVYAGYEQTYQTLGFHFNKYYYESDTFPLGREAVNEGLAQGWFYRREDGSVWIDLQDEGLDEKLLLRSDGTSVYITQDIGTAELKYRDYQPVRSIYVIGNEQDYHMKVLILILRKMGKSWADGVYHLSYGMVDLPSGKMKTREGTVVDADLLVQEMTDTARKTTEEQGKTEGLEADELETLYQMLGLGALKYFLLKVDPQKRILFNPEESIDFRGHTGTFIQYTHARISSILRRAAETGPIPGQITLPDAVAPLERELLRKLHTYPETLLDAARNYSPAAMANYVYELARIYSSFYNEHPILKAEDAERRNFRLALCDVTRRTIAEGMKLLGIDVPTRM